MLHNSLRKHKHFKVDKLCPPDSEKYTEGSYGLPCPFSASHSSRYCQNTKSS